jgi:hypothetical protein
VDQFKCPLLKLELTLAPMMSVAACDPKLANGTNEKTVKKKFHLKKQKVLRGM